MPLSAGATVQPKSDSDTRQIAIVAIVVAAVAVVGLLLVAALFFAWPMIRGATSGGTGLNAGGSPTQPGAVVTTTTPLPPPAQTTVTPPPVVPGNPVQPKSVTSEDGKFPTLVTSAGYSSSGAQRISFDYVQYFTGQAAWKEAAKHGDTADNDYYIVNDNSKIRTYELKPGTKILVHSPGNPNVEHAFTFDQFRDLLGESTLTYGGTDYTVHGGVYWVTIKNHQITRLENIWFP